MNKTMKTLLASVALMVGMTFPSLAQNHQFQSFLNVKALNVGTNSYIITNLANLTTNIGAIYNPSNITYTNLQGTYVGTSTSYLGSVGITNAFTTAQIFKDVALYPDSTGRPMVVGPFWSESAAGLLTNHTWFGNQTLFIEYVNPLVTNAAFGIRFRPIWGDDAGVPIPNNYQADDKWVVVTASLGVNRPKGMLATNFPSHLWPGAKYARVIEITNSSVPAGAGQSIQTNTTFITKLGLSGFRP